MQKLCVWWCFCFILANTDYGKTTEVLTSSQTGSTVTYSISATTEQHTMTTSLHTSRADYMTSTSAVSTSFTSVTGTLVATTSSIADISTTSTRVSSVRTTSGQSTTEQHTTSTSLQTSRTDNTACTPVVSTSHIYVTVATSYTAEISTTSTCVSSDKTTSGQGPDVGIVVGVSVAAVLIVTALIVGIVFLVRRRQKRPDLFNKFAKTKNPEHTDQSIPNPVYADVVEISDSNYADLELTPQDNDSHPYDVLTQNT